MLEKQQLRMNLSENNVDCQTDGDCPAYAIFVCDDNERQMEMLHFDWVDMGSPEVITVTVEPGDKLNTPPVDPSNLLTPKEIRRI